MSAKAASHGPSSTTYRCASSTSVSELAMWGREERRRDRRTPPSGDAAHTPTEEHSAATPKMSTPGDASEHHADQVAERLMSEPEHGASLELRDVPSGTPSAEHVPPIVGEVLASPVPPLDHALRGYFEPRL